MGSNESHFNASLIVTEGQSQKTVSTLTSDPQPFQRKAAESRHSALLGGLYHSKALPLGQTGLLSTEANTSTETSKAY